MQILSLKDSLTPDQCSVLSVGNFDGVHRGHRQLIEDVVKRAKQKNAASVIVTFDPHTRESLIPELPHFLLTTFEEKAAIIEQSGVDYLYKIPFDATFSQMPPEKFVEDILIGKLRMIEWVMGEGHSIGKDRAGGKKFLRNAVGKYHITVFTANLLTRDTLVISSTQIRKYITEGRIAEAVEMLGHPYLIEAIRTSGLKIGTQIGYPTLNFKRPPSPKVIPPPGVYAAELEFDNKCFTGALYFGECPTFSEREVHFEFHAFDFVGDDPKAGERANIWLHRFIRKDRSFSDADSLVEQIKSDVNKIRKYFTEEKLQWR
jgi:riboflavin kinase/FMN adenylyltransferase